jgi:hypothetical protein
MTQRSKTQKLIKQAPRKRATLRFEDVARELGCDEDPAHFEERLKRVAQHKPPADATEKSKKPDS